MTATAHRTSTPPVQSTPFRTWTPAPIPITERETALLTLAREAYDRDPEASRVTLSTESLGAIFAQLDRVEAERDRLGDHGIQLHTSVKRLEKESRILKNQLTATLERYGPVVAWAAKMLRCEASLKSIVAAIAKARR
jgi:hypothetical protein